MIRACRDNSWYARFLCSKEEILVAVRLFFYYSSAPIAEDRRNIWWRTIAVLRIEPSRFWNTNTEIR